MSIGNLILVVNSVTVSYLIRYDSLSKNATAILLQNGRAVYYKMPQVFYYKMRQLLQNATLIKNCDCTMVNLLKGRLSGQMTLQLLNV